MNDLDGWLGQVGHVTRSGEERILIIRILDPDDDVGLVVKRRIALILRADRHVQLAFRLEIQRLAQHQRPFQTVSELHVLLNMQIKSSKFEF